MTNSSHTLTDNRDADGMLPSRDVEFLRNYDYEIIREPQIGIILKSIDLPQNKFSHKTANFLILVPSGYPDNPLDMFYCDPWLKITATDTFPDCANVGIDFNKVSWQRWSRHSNVWRPSSDGIRTMVGRIELALQEA